MPYIEDKQIREALIHRELTPITDGELNFLITYLCHNYTLNHGLRYDTINAVIGVLNCVKSEYYRQIAAPYEDKKKKENGAISSLDSKTLEDVR
jgi:hypothetical protein